LPKRTPKASFEERSLNESPPHSPAQRGGHQNAPQLAEIHHVSAADRDHPLWLEGKECCPEFCPAAQRSNGFARRSWRC